MALSAAEGPPTSFATASSTAEVRHCSKNETAFCQLSGTQDNDADGVNGELREHEVPVGILLCFSQ